MSVSTNNILNDIVSINNFIQDSHARISFFGFINVYSNTTNKKIRLEDLAKRTSELVKPTMPPTICGRPKMEKMFNRSIRTCKAIRTGMTEEEKETFKRISNKSLDLKNEAYENLKPSILPDYLFFEMVRSIVGLFFIGDLSDHYICHMGNQIKYL